MNLRNAKYRQSWSNLNEYNVATQLVREPEHPQATSDRNETEDPDEFRHRSERRLESLDVFSMFSYEFSREEVRPKHVSFTKRERQIDPE